MNKYILPLMAFATFATVLYVCITAATLVRSSPAYEINGVTVRGPTYEINGVTVRGPTH